MSIVRAITMKFALLLVNEKKSVFSKTIMKHRHIALIALLSATLASAQVPRVSTVEFSADADEIITITGYASLAYDVFSPEDPTRVIIDIKNSVHMCIPVVEVEAGHNVQRIRSSQYREIPSKIVRVVIQTIGDHPYLITRRGNALYLDTITEEADPFAGLSCGYSSSIDLENVETHVTTEASTTLLLQNGETGVIGGLLRRKSELIEHGVPLLLSIPVLGLLFKSTSDSAELRELLIFVTPHPVHPE